MDIKIRCSVCGLLMIIEEVSSSKVHSAIVMHVSPCPCSSRIPKPQGKCADCSSGLAHTDKETGLATCSVCESTKRK